MTKKVLGEIHSDLLVNFTHGLDVDKLMYQEEIQVQLAWANSLAKANYITNEELKSFYEAFEAIKKEVEEGRFDWKIIDEDIHMNFERSLTEKLGDLGKKIHYGRSRNDLVVTTQRLFVANSLKEIQVLLTELIKSLTKKAEDHIDVLTPGMTHVQSGQPIRWSQSILSHAQALLRDQKKLKRAISDCTETLPLGAAAFAGTHLKIDLTDLANSLGFYAPLVNSYDAVGDRDFLLSGIDSLSFMATHLARLCSEIIYFASSAVGIYKLPKNWTTGSSIMPNKRNPDTLEITRAKMMRVISSAQEAKGIVAAVIPSYGSDLHELKRTFVKSYMEMASSVEVLIPFMQELEIDQKSASAKLEYGHILATELANKLTFESDGDFRGSYLRIKQMVDEAIEKEIQIHELADWPRDISFESAVEAKGNLGGTAKDQVLKQIEGLNSKLR